MHRQAYLRQHVHPRRLFEDDHSELNMHMLWVDPWAPTLTKSLITHTEPCSVAVSCAGKSHRGSSGQGRPGSHLGADGVASESCLHIGIIWELLTPWTPPRSTCRDSGLFCLGCSPGTEVLRNSPGDSEVQPGLRSPAALDCSRVSWTGFPCVHGVTLKVSLLSPGQDYFYV